MKSRGGKSQRREEKRSEEKRREEERRSKRESLRKGRKVAKHSVFPMICGPGGPKSRLAKAAGAEPAGQMRDEKLHAVVARSTFRSQNLQSTTCSDHFWKLRCQKSARCCGGKHISESKCTKHTMFGPLLEVEMSKKCTLLWREAHFGVKMYKTHHVRTTFGSWDVKKVHAVVARSTFRSQNVEGTSASEHFWKLRCRKKCTLLSREAHFEVKMWKAPHARTTFGVRCRFDLVKSEENVRVLWHFHKRWQAWGIWRGSGKMHFPWQAQYKRHVHQSC